MGSIENTQLDQEAFPPPPTSDLEWNNLGVGVARDVNGYVQSTWTADTKKWSQPQLMKGSTVNISGLSPALNYGMQAYEGMTALRGSDGQIRIFRPDKHAARMQHSCRYVSIPPISEDLFTRCVSLAVAANAQFVPPSGAPAALYIRPLAFGSGPQLNIIAPSEFTFCVFVLPTAALLGQARPISALVLEEFDRAAPNGTGSAKVGGNYAPVMRWQAKAKEEGFGITLHLDSRTQTEIEEFSAAGFIGIKRGKEVDTAGTHPTLVIPESNSIIKSVTSDTCVELAMSMGWNVQIRPVKYEELAEFDEVLAVGTAANIVPIKDISRKSRSDFISYDLEEGQVKDSKLSYFNVLFEALLNAKRGRGNIPESWNVVIKEPASYKLV